MAPVANQAHLETFLSELDSGITSAGQVVGEHSPRRVEAYRRCTGFEVIHTALSPRATRVPIQ